MSNNCSFNYNKTKLTLCWISYLFPSQTLTRSMPIRKLSGNCLFADFRRFDLKTVDESIAHVQPPLLPPFSSPLSPFYPPPRHTHVQEFPRFFSVVFSYWSVSEKCHPNSWPAHPLFSIFHNSPNPATYAGNI